MSTVDEERLEGYRVPAGCRDELIDADGTPLPHAAQLLAALERLGPERLEAAGRRRDTIFMQQGITFEVPDRRRRAPRPRLAARPRAPGPDRRRVDRDQAGSRAADPSAERVRRRRLPRPRDRAGGHRPVVARGQPPPVRPSRPRCAPTRRRVLPCIGLRPRPWRRRPLAGARGQRPHTVGHLLRDREPARDDAAHARAVRGPAHPRGRQLPLAVTGRAQDGRAGRRGRGHGRPVDSGPDELGVLRACLPGPADGNRTGRGRRPRRLRRGLLHAYDERPAARAHDLPSARRRLHRPARVSPRLAARGPGAGAGVPRRHGRDRERGRDRRRRRQGRLPLRARHDPLLPERGADPRERPDVPAHRRAAATARARTPPRARDQADLRVGRQGRVHRPAGHRRPARAPGEDDRARSPSGSSPRS